jgi:hypothetical protein
MVIASLVRGAQGLPVHMPVPETQQSIRSRETFVSGPEDWFTFPDELAHVLKTSPHLTALGKNNWTVVSYKPPKKQDTARGKLFADILAGLKLGLPSILSINVNDHWVVVTRAWLNSNGSVYSIEYIDPAGTHSGVRDARHTYLDACTKDGSSYWMTETPIALAQNYLKVGNLKPRTYKGKYVAVVPGTGAPGSVGSVVQSVVQDGPVPDILTGLGDVASALAFSELATLLAANPHVVTREVKSIQSGGGRYLLGSLFHMAGSAGLVGCFDVATRRVSHFRLTQRIELHRALSAIPVGETLYWTRRRLKTWSLPYYPFQKTAGGQYERLVDRAPLEYA